ncbi:uncharacterized protein LOC107493448 [Arachis duranensis]|uniref:Uncharacterized protein LOC107493448 n=1 Tax=Arachis duranensis TaxID=130453 RepID=A0A6P4DP86_ARADU|nr:uncharacterized protein LOC107493448 [Arachis duranensis]
MKRASDRDIELEDYNSDSEEKFESNNKVVDPGVDEDQTDDAMAADVADVANILTNQQAFEEPTFMRSLDLEAMHAPEFSQYINAAELLVMTDSKFTVGMEFNSTETVIKAMKYYTIRRGVDYWVHESEPMIFYVKCTQYGTYYHSKLDSSTIAEAIKPLVEVDPSIKVKSLIAEVQSKFNYTISYHKAWLANQKAVESIFGGWEASYEALPIWFEAMCHKEPSISIQTLQANSAGRRNSFEGCLLVAVSQDGNNNIVPIAFAIGEGETSEAWLAITRSNGSWSPPRAFHIFCFRHIESNFLRKFKAPYLQKLIINIEYWRMVHGYETRYQRLRNWGEAYTNWLDRIPREQYALAFDGGYQWSHMTTILVECINSVLKGARNLPITTLVKAIFYRLNE